MDHVLAAPTPHPDAPLPQTVLDALAGRHAMRFASATWGRHTAAYREAVGKRGAGFVRGTFEAAWAKRRRIVGSGGGDEEWEGDCGSVGVGRVPDPRALL